MEHALMPAASSVRAIPEIPAAVARTGWLTPGRARWLLAAIVAVSCGATLLAMRRTSTTFDEIVLIAGGARGYETGRFDLAPEHPPLMQYVYGLPVFLDGALYPAEAADAVRGDMGYRYRYSRVFFWQSGNDPERTAFLGRLPAVLCVLLLVLATYGFAAPRIGRAPALLAAGLVALLPDVLAHGGVAYNDLPLALTFLLAVWAFDVTARQPGWRTGAVAGAALALALSVKFSAITLLPVAALLLGCEAILRRRSVAWWRGAGIATAAGIAAAYVSLVAVYRGDFMLSEFFYGLDYTFRHVGQGHGAPGYLLGSLSVTGWWYFFPIAFLFKTPAALHLLGLVAAIGGLRWWLARPRSAAPALELLGSPLRAAVAGALVFGGALITSNLVIGFRYALPLLPLLCILIAAGTATVWSSARRTLRALLVALVVLFGASSLSYYPFFLSYISEYGPGRDRGDLVLLDSSLDWGQGLLALRDFMQEESIDRVFLSYFGSADPRGYGIDYVPLPSFFALEPQPTTAAEPLPEWAVISATNLHGIYLQGDPLARFRAEPDRVLANSLFAYRLHD
jgi:4-amino-4-deoxy-L-arabinose transferase-like glycosyltransferase